MRTFLMAMLFTLVYTIASSQSTNQEISILDRNVNPGQIINELPLPPPGVEGSFYLNESWLIGDFTITNSDKLYKNFPLRYDLKNHILEIENDNKTKVCTLPVLKTFSYRNQNNVVESYINTSLIDDANKILPKSIAQIFYEDKLLLIGVPYIEVKDPTYVAAIDMGNRNKTILKKVDYYVVINKKAHKITGSSFKKNQEIFGNKGNDIESFTKENKLKFNREMDLVKIFDYYNSFI
ncbi:hypothetical protein JMN32_16910 [Fulvivirga sp. 29W222]|uniref:Plasminogen-binding protein PgbA N-terminal domain-containing protein n=1 Tax=Fulvivirga marina TaxID=2494733 RepID=A0A937FXJ2_9BACT|nr:hypothetical protein [Fulvivirga marina]MBL6448000.1 hypothetical protein [Fulvivirga marina]